MTTAHCEWGPNGIAALRGRAKVFVIVDVLSFSTAVDIAVARGASIVPFPLGSGEAAAIAARASGAILANPKRAAGGQYSLSPASLQTIAAGTKLMLPSPNGSKLSLACGGAIVFAGCLRNAAAVAKAALHAAEGGDIAVIPAGERWRSDDSLRPAIEDWLGAGAVLAALDVSLSAEARVARDTFEGMRAALAETIRDSLSGRELIEAGFAEDVALAIQRDVSLCAPRLQRGCYTSGI